MDAVPHVNAAVPAVVPRQQQIANPVAEVAGQILFSIGIIFATVPIWSYFAAVVVPNPYLIAIGGIAFCALGIKLLIDNIVPPQPPPPAPPPRYQRQRSLSLDGDERFSRSRLPETPDLSPKHKTRPRRGSHGDIAKMAAPPDVSIDPALHDQELEELEDDKKIKRLLQGALQLAQLQIQAEPMEGVFGYDFVELPTPIEPFPVKHLYGCDFGMASSDNPFCPETFICQPIRFTNTMSREDVLDHTQIPFAGAVLALVTGYGDPTAMSFVEKNLTPTLIRELEQRRLTERGIFNSLKHTFAKLDVQCFAQRQTGAATLLVALFLGRRLWIATIGRHRAFFISDALLSQTRDILSQQQKYEESFEPHTPRSKQPDLGRIASLHTSPAKSKPDGVPESEFKASSDAPKKAKTITLDEAVEDTDLLDGYFDQLEPKEESLPRYGHLLAAKRDEPPLQPQRPNPIPFPQALSAATGLVCRSFQKEDHEYEDESLPSFKMTVPDRIWNEAHFIGGPDQKPKRNWASPNITFIHLEQQGFLVLGSVGFGTPWAPSRQVVKHLAEHNEERVEDLARELVEIVCKAGSFLNVTAIVAKITSRTLQIAVGEK